MSRVALAGALWVSLVAASCEGCEPKVRLPPPPAGLQVLDLGRPPRVRLRYRFRPGETLRYRLTTERRSLHLADPGTRLVTTLSRYVDRVRAPRAQVRWRLYPAASARSRRGTTVWLQVDDRGRVEATRFPGVSAERARTLRTLLRNLHAPWPVPAVGVGARWSDRRRARVALGTGKPGSSVETTVESRYRLERVGPCGRTRCAYIGVHLSLWSEHSRAGLTVRGTGRGQGQIAFDLDRGILVRSHTRAELDLSAGPLRGRAQERYLMTQDMELMRGR